MKSKINITPLLDISLTLLFVFIIFLKVQNIKDHQDYKKELENTKEMITQKEQFINSKEIEITELKSELMIIKEENKLLENIDSEYRQAILKYFNRSFTTVKIEIKENGNIEINNIKLPENITFENKKNVEEIFENASFLKEIDKNTFFWVLYDKDSFIRYKIRLIDYFEENDLRYFMEPSPEPEKENNNE